MCAARFLTSKAKGRASARWWRKSRACADEPPPSAHELAAINLDALGAAILAFQRHRDLVAAGKPARRDAEAGLLLARHLLLRHHRRRVEFIGHGGEAPLHAFRRLKPKLEMIERPGALDALDLGRLRLDPSNYRGLGRKRRERRLWRSRLRRGSLRLRRRGCGGVERHRLDRIPWKSLARSAPSCRHGSVAPLLLGFGIVAHPRFQGYLRKALEIRLAVLRRGRAGRLGRRLRRYRRVRSLGNDALAAVLRPRFQRRCAAAALAGKIDEKATWNSGDAREKREKHVERYEDRNQRETDRAGTQTIAHGAHATIRTRAARGRGNVHASCGLL